MTKELQAVIEARRAKVARDRIEAAAPELLDILERLYSQRNRPADELRPIWIEADILIAKATRA